MTEQKFEKLVKRFVVYYFHKYTCLKSLSEDDMYILKTYCKSNPYMATAATLNPGIIVNVTYDIEQKVAYVARYLRYKTDRIMESELE